MTSAEWKSYVETLDNLYTKKRGEWGDLLKDLNLRLMKAGQVGLDDLVNVEALALSFRHILSDEIAFYSLERRKYEAELKNLILNKRVSYVTGTDLTPVIKTAISTKAIDYKILIADELRYQERNLEALGEHIIYLKSLRTDLESYSYAVKNKIEILKIKAGL